MLVTHCRCQTLNPPARHNLTRQYILGVSYACLPLQVGRASSWHSTDPAIMRPLVPMMLHEQDASKQIRLHVEPVETGHVPRRIDTAKMQGAHAGSSTAEMSVFSIKPKQLGITVDFEPVVIRRQQIFRRSWLRTGSSILDQGRYPFCLRYSCTINLSFMLAGRASSAAHLSRASLRDSGNLTLITAMASGARDFRPGLAFLVAATKMPLTIYDYVIYYYSDI